MIEEHHKPEMLARGRWVAARPEVKTRGYHINGLYAPIGLGKTWVELAQEWLDAQKDPVALKTFINTELAETWEDRSHAVKPKHLSERAGPQKAREIPLGCLLLTCGVDTQDDRLEVHVIGHGPMHGHGGAERGLIHWTIDYLVIPGNPAHDAVWETLAQVLNRPYVNARGRELLIEATAIDEGGHHTDDVRWFATQGKAKRTMAVKGMNRASRTIMPGGPKPTDINRLGKKLTGGARTWDVGTDVAKSYLVKNLVADGELQAEAQRVRFHAELEDTFYAGLLAESFDPSRNRWIKKAGRRNEPLDTWGYAWFAAHHPQVAVARKTRKEWAALAAILEPALQEDGTVPAVVAKPAAEKPGFRVKPGMTKPSGGRGGDGGFY